MTMPFLRPEAKVWLLRWRETLAAAAIAALGLWWLTTAAGLLAWVGGVLAAAGGAAGFAAFQRARFRRGGGGAGVVQVDEGRLTYFGPLTGGSVAVRDIQSVGLDPRHRPVHWVLSDGVTDLAIPVDAEGADGLFDVFTQLPGLDPRTVVAASERGQDVPTTLWRRATVPASRRLH